MKRIISCLLVLVILSGFILTGCSGRTAVEHNHPMSPLEDLPTDVQRSGHRVREAYQFAVANPHIADEIPCYCGCAGMGHTSSYACYVAGVDENGAMRFDTHAQYCSICVDIIHDTMRMVDEDKSTPEIFTQIEADYARFGPPTVKAQTGESS